MSNLTGMDVDEVQRLAADLERQAATLDHIVASINNLVAHGSPIWSGPDFHQFQEWWSSKYRLSMQSVTDSVRGLGQTAKNNAKDQVSASGGGPAAAGVAAAAGAGAALAAGGTVAQRPAATNPTGVVGATNGQLIPQGQVSSEYYRARAGLHPSSAEWAQGNPANGQADQWGKAGNNCTSWVALRRSELGLDIPAGNGGAMGHDVAGKPTLGAVVSYGSGIGTDYGHVMIVEQVDSPDKFRVSEMNYDNKGGLRDSTVWTHNANGTWSSSTGATKSLKFTP